ncbi:alpha/beta hydrolase family protein [Deinococcus navajonensis]|uniref:Uncharacterized protein n=1 Tax=Deinococcus navajonensis TaxID=309884 RepID=A0ABV8XTG2_9DEIO
MKPARFALSAAVMTSLLSACTSVSTPPTTEEALRAAATKSGVTGLSITKRDDGGLNVSGTLAGNVFAVRVPANWNHQSMLYAHGYVTPAPGATEKAPTPATDPAFGLLTTAYNQGYAAADTAYAKVGYAVKEGVEANKALRDMLVAAGSTKQYMTGVSMGGNITVAMIEKYPNDFSGALSLCGVNPGWASEMRYLFDVRVVYDYLTKGTPYALPGNGDALTPNAAYTIQAVQQSVIGLFTAAGKGDATAKAIIGQLASVTGVSADPVSLITALASTVYGLSDLLNTAGGAGYSNVGRVYTGSLNDAALNAGVQRVSGSAASQAYLAANYTATGKFNAKLLTVHNLSDPLVPYLLEPEFAAIVKAAGNSANLVQQVVDAKPVNLADPATSGPAHCYFTPAQVSTAWNELRGWVDQGVRPPNGANITRVN